MSSLFRSSVIPGTRLTDIVQSGADVGQVMPWGFGRYVSQGNIIFAPLPPKEHRKVTRQGKGGVKSETFSYTLSHAAAFGRRQIYGYWWIERNGKIVYTRDPNASVDDQAYAAKWLQKATLYYGTRTQLPDSTIESYEGSGQVSAFRGVPYISVEDDDVTDSGGAAPSYRACIIASPPEAYLTSGLYPLFTYDGVDVQSGPTQSFDYLANIDGADAGDAIESGFIEIMVRYLGYEIPAEGPAGTAESVNVVNAIASGLLQSTTTYQSYTIPVEGTDPVNAVLSGTLTVVAGYVTYVIPTEAVDPADSIQGGTLI